jgi:hypothetical protein
MRGYVIGFPARVLVIVIDKRLEKLPPTDMTMPNRDIPNTEETHIRKFSGTARHSCARARFDRQRTARPTSAAVVLNCLNFVGRVTKRPTIFNIYGAMRSVSVSV